MVSAVHQHKSVQAVCHRFNLRDVWDGAVSRYRGECLWWDFGMMVGACFKSAGDMHSSRWRQGGMHAMQCDASKVVFCCCPAAQLTSAWGSGICGVCIDGVCMVGTT